MAEIVFSGDSGELGQRALEWARENFFSTTAAVEFSVILGICLVALALCRALRLGVKSAPPQTGWRADERIAPMLRELRHNSWPGVSGLLLLLVDAAAKHAKQPHQLVSIAAAVFLAWVVAHVASRLIRSRFLGRLVAFVVWAMAVLHALGLSEPALEFLDDVGFAIGKSHVSLLLLLKGLALFVVLIQSARLFAGIFDDKLQYADGISPSAQVLFAKGARFGLYALAVTITLSSVGVDLTSLTVFSGAVGVGVGFGLQKIFSNFVSGVILLLDKSLKPGDVIDMNGVQGRIAQINARYAAVETLDGKAYLIPNENLIGNEVINLSYSNSRLLIRADVGVAYDADPRQAMELMVQAALSTPRVLAEPAPKCLLTSFGDSSINLSVGFWIEDPHEGIGNVRGDVLLAIWDAFNAAGVSIPFPQREVRMLKE